MPLADGQPLVLREVSGTLSVTLALAALPGQGVEAPATLRSVTTHYPGSSAPSTQVMGTREEPIELSGQWRDVWLGLEGASAELVTACRRLFLGQRYCELAWGELLVRRGYVKAFAPKYLREGEIDWKLTFEVAEADDPEVISTPYAEVKASTDLLDVLHAISASLDDVAEAGMLITSTARLVT